MTEAMIRKKPGMASMKNMPVLQDGPPPSGFASVRFARPIPNTGPSAIAIFLTTFGAFSWGMYQVGQGNKIRRILTWEDAFYDNLNNCATSQSMYCQNNLDQICGGNFSNDPLGLSLTKMSYHEYSLGEGIVGQVAVNGKHRWIFADNQVTCSGPSFKLADEWQSQFSAGVRVGKY